MTEQLQSYQITCGDSRELIKLLPNNSVDFILTDPPYNLAQHSTGNINLPGRSAMNNDLAEWDLVDFNPEEWIDEFIRVLKPTGNLFIFTSYNQIGKWYELLDKRFDATNYMIWHKTNPAPKIFKAGFLNSCEMIYTCWNKKHTWNFISQAEMHNFIESPICMKPERLDNPKHPTQKPIAILKKLITIASNEGDIVYDPFMGVGSTGVAALALGRKFIGSEISQEYYNAAEMRIKNEAIMPSLFGEFAVQVEPQAKKMTKTKEAAEVCGLKPIIKWPGGKEKELPFIKRYAPDFFINYYEPFVGGGSVFAAMEAKHLFINDKSDELISLYRCIASQNKCFFRWMEDIMAAWKNMLDYVKNKPQMIEWYFDLRNGKIDVTRMRGKLHLFIKSEWENIKQVLPNSFDWDLQIFESELSRNLTHKVLRMHKIEKDRGFMVDGDIYDNIETAFMSALYMYFRGLYNNKELMIQQPILGTALFVFLRNFAYSGMFRYNANGEFNVPYGGISYNHKMLDSKVAYYQSKALLNHFAKTTIENYDFLEFFRRNPPTAKDFIFLDPPYDTEFSTYAQNEFSKEDQERLANYLINECKGQWQMIIKYTDFIYSLYNKPGIYIHKFDKKYQVSFMNRNDKEVEHLIITNYKNKYD